MSDEPTGILKITEYRMGRQKTVKEEWDMHKRKPKPNAPVELTMKLAKADTAEQKRILVEAHMGELFYAFGDIRRAWKPWLTYMENMEVQYIGEKHGNKEN